LIELELFRLLVVLIRKAVNDFGFVTLLVFIELEFFHEETGFYLRTFLHLEVVYRDVLVMVVESSRHVSHVTHTFVLFVDGLWETRS
jgi:hypothetical protein